MKFLIAIRISYVVVMQFDFSTIVIIISLNKMLKNVICRNNKLRIEKHFIKIENKKKLNFKILKLIYFNCEIVLFWLYENVILYINLLNTKTQRWLKNEKIQTIWKMNIDSNESNKSKRREKMNFNFKIENFNFSSKFDVFIKFATCECKNNNTN